MNAFGIALLWCVLQVTLVGLLAAGFYLVVRRFWAAAAVPVVLAGLATVVVLSLLVSSPWPRWVMHGAEPVEASAGVETVADDAVSGPANVESEPGAKDVKAEAVPLKPGGENTRPAAGGVFWQAFLEELSKPQPVARSDARKWPAVMGVLLLGAMGCGLVRLVLGVAAVRRERVRSRPVEDGRLIELVDVLCAELGCRRAVEVRECGDLATPATIGWRRPVLLVPADWTSWTADECRAVLAHELAHVRSHDCLTLLLAQLGVALHFYHPLVHWLAGRLRLEQELAADAAAASVSGGQRAYLLTIARLALRQQDRPMPWPARTFLPTRTTFLRRIAMLRDSKLSFERVSPAVRVVVIGAVLLGGLLIAGLRGPGWQTEARAETAGTTVAGEPAAPEFMSVVVQTIDTSFIPKPCKMFLILRPSEVAARPELAPWTVFFDKAVRDWPKGLRAVDFRQITVVFSEKVAPSGEIVVLQGVKPLDASALWPARPGHGRVEYVGGKKMYLGVGDGSDAVLQYDEHTVIWASNDKELRAYLAGKRGTLPRWFPKETWETYRADHVVWALDMEGLQREVRRVVDETRGSQNSPATTVTLLATLSPLWENSTSLVLGLRAGDAVDLHAVAAADSEDEAEAIEKTVDAARVLALNFLKEAERNVKEKGMSAEQTGPLPLLIDLLRAAQVERKGTMIAAQGSIDLATVKKMESVMVAAEKAGGRAQSVNNLKMLGIAMHNYHDAHRCFPPAVLYGPDGKTPHSWRVAILPYVDQQSQALYNQYHLDEPWDSPANREVLAKMPDMFRSPTEPAGSTNACYFALIGPGTVFDATRKRATPQPPGTTPAFGPGPPGAGPMTGPPAPETGAAGRGPSVRGMMGPMMGGAAPTMGPGEGGYGPMGPAVGDDRRNEGISLRDITDGSSNTILLVEAKRDIPWTKPEDIPYASDKPLPELGGFFDGAFNVVLCDGCVRMLYQGIAEKTLRAMITRAGGENVNANEATKSTGATEWPSNGPPPGPGTPPQLNQGWGLE